MPFDMGDEAGALRRVLNNLGDVRLITDQLESLPVAALVVDDSGRFIAANQRGCELTGYTREELLTLSVTDITHPGDLPTEERLWRAFERWHHQCGRYALTRKDGVTVQVDYEAFWDLGPGIHVSFLHPITPDARSYGPI